MIFVFGIPSSGTRLVAKMIGLHPDWTVALDPFMPIFRAMRNAALEIDIESQHPFEPLIHEEILNFDLSRPFYGDHNKLTIEIFKRTSLEAKDLGGLINIEGRTFRQLFESGIALIKKARLKQHVVIKEVWTTDFTATLANAFPEAKFVFVKRELKAILASMEKIENKSLWATDMAEAYTAHWHKHNRLIDRFTNAWPHRTRVVHYERAIPFVNDKGPTYKCVVCGSHVTALTHPWPITGALNPELLGHDIIKKQGWQVYQVRNNPGWECRCPSCVIELAGLSNTPSSQHW